MPKVKLTTSDLTNFPALSGNNNKILAINDSGSLTWISFSAAPAYKEPVRVATAVALPSNTQATNVLTASVNGVLPAIDGVSLSLGDRLLVKNEAAGEKNGIYTVTSLGSASLPWSLARTSDADTENDLPAGTLVLVSQGIANRGSVFALLGDAALSLNVTALNFVRVGGGNAMSAPALVFPVAGSSNATYALPGAGAEMVWKGGAIQVPGTDYTRTGNSVTFAEGNVPVTGEPVVISVAQSAVTGPLTLTRAVGETCTPRVVAPTPATWNATYALPGAGAEMVWKGGAIQVPGADYTRTGNSITFAAENVPEAGEPVVISVAQLPLVGSFGLIGDGCALGTPVVVAATAGSSNATYALPGAGAEMVWKGGAIQAAGTDYTRTGNSVTFAAENVPGAGEPVVISVAPVPFVGTDAATLAGQEASIATVPNTIVQRGVDGTLRASNHESLGAPGGAGTVVVADSAGLVPTFALPNALGDFPSQAGQAGAVLNTDGTNMGWIQPISVVVGTVSQEGNTWLTRPNLSRGRGWGSYGVIGNYVYMAGGIVTENGTSSRSASTEAYDPFLNVSIEKALGFYTHYASAGATIGEKLYVQGGNALDGGADVYSGGWIARNLSEYDSKTNTWTAKAYYDYRSLHAATALDGKLYVHGGFSGGGSYHPNLGQYDPATNTWVSKASLPWTGVAQEVGYAGGVGLNGRLYHFGDNLTAEYNPATNTWVTKASTTGGWGKGHRVVTQAGKIYHVVGVNTSSYDPVTNTWLTGLSSPAYSRGEGPMLVNIENQMFFLGGRFQDYVERYVFENAHEFIATKLSLVSAYSGANLKNIISKQEGSMVAAKAGDIVHANALTDFVVT